MPGIIPGDPIMEIKKFDVIKKEIVGKLPYLVINVTLQKA
jgi:hypothetical protein